MKVLVQLVGGQPLPNFLVPAFIEPNKTILFYTSQTDEVRKRLEAVIGQCQSQICDAYDIEAIATALQTELEHYDKNDEFIFNLTGGTKAMVLAANQVAMTKQATVVYLESERRQNVLYKYCYDQGNALKLEQKEELPSLITIGQFLDVHIGKEQWKETGPSTNDGGRFERAVADAIRSHFPQAEVRQGIRFLGNPDGKRPQIDLDIVVRCGNQFARIECKDKGKLDLDAVRQLNLVTELLGTYTRKFIALTGKQTPEHQTVCDATRTAVIDELKFACNASSASKLEPADAERLARKIGEAIGC